MGGPYDETFDATIKRMAETPFELEKTMDLRFIERRSPDSPPRRLLQQRVVLSDGSDSWLDIPFVPDGAEEVGG